MHHGTPIKIVYFGTPGYAVPSLMRLVDDSRFDVRLVVTQPDRPSGRGRTLQSPAVKIAAQSLKLPVYQPGSLKDKAAREPLEIVEADLFVVAAYGLIFGSKTLATPRYGCLNLHASLLPKYRGASPVSAAILAGDATTGVSLMKMELGLDTGPVIDTFQVDVSETDTTESLTELLATAGAELAVNSIPRFFADELVPIPQPAHGASQVRPLMKADGWLDWEQDAVVLERRVRAMWPWPRAWTTFNSHQLQVHKAASVEIAEMADPGTVILGDRYVVVVCGNCGLRLDIVQPASGKPIAAHAWVSGHRIPPGARLGIDGLPESQEPLIVSV